MDGRRSFPEDPEPRWYADGDRDRSDSGWRGATGEHHTDDGRRPPGPRGAVDGESLDVQGRRRGRRSAERYGADPFAPDGEAGRHDAATVEGDRYREPWSLRAGTALDGPPVDRGVEASGGVDAVEARMGDPGRPAPLVGYPIVEATRAPGVDQPGPPPVTDVPTGPTNQVTPRSAPAGDGPGFPTESIDREALRRAAGPAGHAGPGGYGAPASGGVPGPAPQPPGPVPPTGPPGDGIYRTRRPAVAVLFAIPALIFEILALRVLVAAVLDGPLPVGPLIAGMLLTAGLPIFTVGLYGLVTGTVPLTDPGRVWLRPPTAYLTVGLVLLVAAALAAG